MGIFQKLFGEDDLSSLDKLRLETEKGFEKIVEQSLRKGSMVNDPLLGGMYTYHRILEAGKVFKRDFVVLSQNLEITELEVNKVIDDVQMKILKKYFENFD